MLLKKYFCKSFFSNENPYILMQIIYWIGFLKIMLEVYNLKLKRLVS